MTNSELWDKAVQCFNERDLAGASMACEGILRDSPEDSLAHWLLSSISIETGSPRSAASHALMACRGSGRLHVEEKLKISWTLIVTGETEAAYGLLSGIDPEDKQLHPWFFEAAHQLSMIEFPVQAKRLLDKVASDSMFQPPEICMLRGHLLSTLGDRDGAEELLEDAIAFGAPTPRPHLLLSRLNLERGRPQRIDRLRRLAASMKGSPEWIAMIHYSLFNELDGAGDYCNAWDALAFGAATLRGSIHYDPVQESEIFGNLARAFEDADGGSARHETQIPEGAPTPIFIVGLPRTGTTLVEQILGNHPDVCAGGELLTLAQQIQWISDRVWDGPYDVRASLDAASLDSALLGERYLRGCEWRMQGFRCFTDKNPRNFTSIGHILTALPQARIVHVQRSPVDACFSNFKMLFGPNIYPYSYDLDELALHFRNYSGLMDAWNRIFPGRIFNLSYEELVHDGAGMSRRMLEFCGLAPNNDLLDLSGSRRAIMTESRSQLRSGIQDKYIGAWKRYERQLEPLVSRLQTIA